jgi:glucokinase
MSRFAVGVDLGGTNLRVAAVDEHGTMLGKHTTGHKSLGSSERIVAVMCEHIQQLKDQFKDAGRFEGVGIGIPGIIDLRSGILRESPNLPGWHDYPVRDDIEQRLGMRVILENDANAGAMGEFWLGGARHHDSMFMLTLGTGVGGGIILDGVLWHGMTGMAGEPGHMTVDPDGPLCPCGNNGCLEQFAGATAIVRMAKETAAAGKAPAIARAIAENEPFTSKAVYQLAKQGDGPSLEIFRTMGTALGIALAGMINALNLPIFIIGGGGSGAWDVFSPHIFTEVERRSFVYRVARQTQITAAQLGPDAGLFGAARLPMLPDEARVHMCSSYPALTAAQASKS